MPVVITEDDEGESFCGCGVEGAMVVVVGARAEGGWREERETVERK